MKTKYIIIAVVALFIIGASAYYVKAKYFGKLSTNDAELFLNNFNQQVVSKNTDSIATYFDVPWNKKLLKQFINVLINKSSVNVGEAATLALELKVDEASYIEKPDDELETIVPVKLTNPILPDGRTTLSFTLRKQGIHGYSIVLVDNKDFLKDYLTYQNSIQTKDLPDKDIYSPATLQAFKTAEQLKTKYDSVIWFSHINKQTYYYVITGKWDYYNIDSAKTYKMGLVNPQQKEIIPADYDLIYSINGTFNGLVEVEKDRKRGFYDLNGKIVIPVEYDQVFPVSNSEHLAALRKNDNYYWLEKDYSIGAEANISIKDLFAMLPPTNLSNIDNLKNGNVMELNSRDNHSSILISPSYLADLNLMEAVKYFKNPLRKNVEFFDASSQYKVAQNNKTAKADTGRFEALVYSIRDYFIGGRSEFYDVQNLVLVDKNSNKIFSKNFQVDYSMSESASAPEKCDGFSFRSVTDTLFELKTAASTSVMLYDDSNIEEMPVYHYLYLHNNKIQEKPTGRIFAFTKFVQMDNSYVTGCYYYNDKVMGELTPEMLRYMKNEIYADYHYKFKDKKWKSIFEERMYDYKAEHESVEDSLTAIDRFNLNWINQKLKVQTPVKLAAR